MEATERRLREFIVGELLHAAGPSALPADARLLEDGILDSLSLQQLIEFIEQEFELQIDDEHLDPDNFATLRAIAALVDRLRR